MSRVSNQQIVQELRNGDRLGCRHLVDLYQKRLIAEATGTFHVPFLDAEELVSDVLCAVVEKIQSFRFKRADGDFHFWVMAIFRNRVRDFKRRQSLTDGLWESFDEAALEEEQAYSDAEREVVHTVLRSYEESIRGLLDEESSPKVGGALEAVAETLDRMEAWERVLLRCRALGVPYEEIAQYTGKSPKQLKVYHARVKKKFVKILSQIVPEIE